MNVLRDTQRILTLARSWALVVLVFAVFGVGSALAAEPIRVGVTASLSGRLAAPGREQLEGIQMWVDDINGRGALLGRGVELVYYDDKSDPATSARLYEKLISQDKVLVIGGGYSSTVTWAAISIAQTNKIPFLVNSAAADKITEQG